MNNSVTKRQRLESRRVQLENERSSFVPQWRDLNDYILPHRARFSLSDTNKGDRRNFKIIDGTATMSARTAQSGMMAGVTSPARPWFRLTTPDPALAELQSVKEWLHTVTQRMSSMFLKSNLYNVLPQLYGDILVFATGAVFVEKDVDDVLRFSSIPIGEYCLAKDRRGKINEYQRTYRITIDQLVEEFAERDPVTNKILNWDNISTYVKDQYEQGNGLQTVDVCHFIYPNPDYNPSKLESKFKRYSSCYYEIGTSSSGRGNHMAVEGDKFLSEKGFNRFPVLAPRWSVTGSDVYGTSCPGMIAIGDIKQLQMGEKRGMQAIEKMINPSMVAPPQVQQSGANLLPGGITFLAEQGDQKFRAAHEVNLRVDHLENKQEQVRQRIRKAFFEDLFLMLANDTRSGVTAREIEERHQEKFLAIGPVLEQLNEDVLDDLINFGFEEMFENGLLPVPPEELQGVDLKVEYISPMAQAQKATSVGSIESLARFVGVLAQTDASIIDKVNLDQFVDEYADGVGASPKLVKSDEEAMEIRKARAQAQQQAQQAEVMMQSSQVAKNLSQTQITDDSALKQLLMQANAGNPMQ